MLVTIALISTVVLANVLFQQALILAAPPGGWWRYHTVQFLTFEGMQPTLRQVPPKVAFFSTHTVCTEEEVVGTISSRGRRPGRGA